MAKQKFSAMEREALWIAYDRKCAYTREPISYPDFHIDHILPEFLLDDPDQLAKTKSDLNLAPDFDLLGFENLVPCKPQTNLQKGSVIFNPSSCQFFLGMALAKKPKVEFTLETINRRNNSGKAIMLLQQCLQRGEIKPEDIESILEQQEGQPEEIFDLIESLTLTDGEELKSIKKCDVGQLRKRPVNLDPNFHIGGLTLQSGREEIMVRTCEEYSAAIRAGFYPCTGFDRAIATFFVRQCGLLDALDNAMVASKSFISEPRVGITDLYLMPFALFPIMEHPPDHSSQQTYQDMVDNGDLFVKRVRHNSLAVESNGMGQHLNEVARADFNGDGLEEILIYEYCYAIGGTLRWASTQLLGRQGDNGLFEIVQATKSPC